MPTAYCITGYPGAGKSEATQIAAKLGHETIVMGDIVRCHAQRELGEDASSDEISNWADAARDEDEAIVAHLTIQTLEPIENDVVIDGIRSPAELPVFEEAFDEVVVIEVWAPDATRRNRIADRGRRGEDEQTLSKRDEAEEEWGLAEIVSRADERVVNDADLENLKSELVAVIGSQE